MIVYFDNIIYNLQRKGEESRLWATLTRGLLAQPEVELRFIEYRNAIENEYRYRLDLVRHGYLYIMCNLRLTRHLAVRIDGYDSPFIFHSSGYRLCDNPHAINIITVNGNGKPSFMQRRALHRCDYIICTSQAAIGALDPELKFKATLISKRKSNDNIALATLKLYRRAIVAHIQANK